MVNVHSGPILPYTTLAKAQSPMEEHMVHALLRLTDRFDYKSLVRQIIFTNRETEVKENMKWMNERMKLHDEGWLKSEDEIGETGEPR